MKSKSVKIRILTLLLCAATVCFAFTVIGTNKVQAQGNFVGEPFGKTYEYGATITMPASLQIVSDGNTFTANKSYIRFPDGNLYKGGNYNLNSFGGYEIVYEAEANGKKITATHLFNVKMPIYSTGKGATYDIATLNDDFNKNKETKGLSVKLGSGETFTYNKTFNVYEMPETELLWFNVMHFDPIAKELVVTLTDCYDSSRFIEIVYRKVAYSETYISVGADRKAVVGITNRPKSSSDKVFYIDGEGYKVNDKGGIIVSNRKWERHVAAGLTKDRYNNMKLSLDMKNKERPRVYVRTAPETGYNDLFAELNNPDIYNYKFDGFTTGEVRLSITAKTLIGADSVELQIASMCGVSGEDLKGGFLVDEKGPEIVVNSEKTSLNVMAGVPIPVPTATAYDVNGIAGKVDYSVYYGYGTSFQKSIVVKNGILVPSELGTYTIIYTARDVFGNTAKKTLTLNAVKEGEQGIDFTCEKVTEAVAGNFISLDNYSAKSLNTTATVTVSVTGPDGKPVAVASDMTMLCEAVGEYTVTYEYFDDLYSGSYTYKFTARNGGISRFERNSVLTPDYMIKGASYSVDKVNAYKYSSITPSLEKVNYTISYDGGAFTSFNPDEFTVTGANTLKIRYALASDGKVFIESKEVKIVDVGYGETVDGPKYFAGDFVGRIDESTPDYMTYALTVKNSGSLDFINPLLMSAFSMRYSLSAQVGSYSFTFTDFYDRSNVVTIEFVEGGVKINGEFKAVSYNSSESVNVSYTDGNIVIGSTSIPFDMGFTSDKMLFGIHFDSITTAGHLNVYSICNQTFGYYVTSDNVKPIISVEHADRVASVGDVITIYAPEVADVLSPSPDLKCVVSVYKNGTPVKSIDGVILTNADAFAGYSFKIDGFGSYLVLYQYTDGSGKVGDDRFAITVTDIELPEITLNDYDGKPIQASINTELSPLAYTVKDNITATDKINVTIVVYNSKRVAVCVSNDKFTLTKAGKYTVYIYCTDEAGNTAYVSYEVNAK